jgi:N-carbamoyl-L-amino-acid hydrolase
MPGGRWCAKPAEAAARLIRAHPELAGKAMVAKTLTAESTNEQGKAGLTDCTPRSLRASSSSTPPTTQRFGFPSSWPCAARAARACRSEIIATFERRLHNHPDFEWPSACATSTASPRSAWTTSSAS